MGGRQADGGKAMSPVTDELNVGSKWKKSLQTKLVGKLRKGSPNHLQGKLKFFV